MTDVEAVDGNELAVDAHKNVGVTTIYGVVGIPVTDLARTAQARGIRYPGFRNEVSAPGFLNGLAALANATTDRFPIVRISGSGERSIVDGGQPRGVTVTVASCRVAGARKVRIRVSGFQFATCAPSTSAPFGKVRTGRYTSVGAVIDRFGT